MGAMHWQQLVQLLVAELARKDQAASAERAAMRAEAMHAVAQAARAQALAECAGRERYDLALSAERERFDLAVSAERAKAAEHKEAMWVARIMALQHKLDLSEGAGRARSLFKACTRDIAKRVGAAALLLSGPICPALCAYIDAVARANNLDPEEVMQQARCMYGARSDPPPCTASRACSSCCTLRGLTATRARRRLLPLLQWCASLAATPPCTPRAGGAWRWCCPPRRTAALPLQRRCR